MNAQHQASAAGDLLPRHYEDGWPLREGVAHALRLRKQGLSTPRWHGNRRLVPFGRSVELVICYCSERLSWLSAFVQLPWRDEDRSKAVKQVALSFYHKRLGPNG